MHLKFLLVEIPFCVFKQLEIKVEDHKEKVEETLTKGSELTKGSQLAPEIVVDQVENLDRLWSQVLELIVQRRRELEETLEHWSTFVKQLETLMGKMNERDCLLKEQGTGNFQIASEEAAEQKIAEFKVRFAASCNYFFLLIFLFFHLNFLCNLSVLCCFDNEIMTIWHNYTIILNVN